MFENVNKVKKIISQTLVPTKNVSYDQCTNRHGEDIDDTPE